MAGVERGEMKRNQKIFIGIMIAVAMLFTGMLGCSTSQCAKFQAAYGAAQAGYTQAVTSGVNTAKVDKWRWTADALAASVNFWCASQTELVAE